MNSIAQKCECCEDMTYYVQIDHDMISYKADRGFVLELSEEELTDLYFTLKEYKCQ